MQDEASNAGEQDLENADAAEQSDKVADSKNSKPFTLQEACFRSKHAGFLLQLKADTQNEQGVSRGDGVYCKFDDGVFVAKGKKLIRALAEHDLCGKFFFPDPTDEYWQMHSEDKDLPTNKIKECLSLDLTAVIAQTAALQAQRMRLLDPAVKGGNSIVTQEGGRIVEAVESDGRRELTDKQYKEMEKLEAELGYE